jgi:hypothetical protein
MQKKKEKEVAIKIQINSTYFENNKSSSLRLLPEVQNFWSIRFISENEKKLQQRSPH